jgi:hypothetical protein
MMEMRNALVIKLMRKKKKEGLAYLSTMGHCAFLNRLTE